MLMSSSSDISHPNQRPLLIFTGRIQTANRMFVSLFQLTVACVTAVSLYLSYWNITASIARRNAISKHRCKAPLAYPHKDPFFGLDAVRDAITAAKSKTSIARQIGQHLRYGSTFSSKFFMTPVISTSEPENIKAVLSTNFGDYGIGSRRKRAFAPLLGKSIFQVDGPQWKHSRDLLQLCLTRSQVVDLPMFDLHVTKLIKAISRHGSATVDLGIWFPRLIADFSTDCFFGKGMGSIETPSSLSTEFVQAMHDAQAGCEDRWKLGHFSSLFPHREFYRNVKRVHDFIDQHMERAMGLHDCSEGRPEVGRSEGEDRRVFLYQLSKLTDDQQFLRDEILTIFSAAFDPVAALLTNLFFVLAKRPDVWELLRGEVRPLDGENPDISQLRSLKYHQFCLKECEGPLYDFIARIDWKLTSGLALRLHPILPSNSRVAYKDTILPRGGGPDQKSPVFVAEGTMVAFGIAAMHRRKDLWGEDADDFRPERWRNDKSSWVSIALSLGLALLYLKVAFKHPEAVNISQERC